MSFEQATQALEGAIEADNAPVTLEQAPSVPTPEGETTPQVQPHHAQTQPRDPATGKFVQPDGSLSDTPAPTVPDTFDGGKFNPDTLPPELQPGWKQLQADYTRKMQEVAQQRAQFEQFGDPNEVAQATQLYRALQDPTYLRQFHTELTSALERQGLSRADASAEAARQTEAAATGTDLSALANDPELAPLAKQLQDTQARLDRFEQAQNAREEQERLAQWQMAVAGELQRQDMAIRQSNPEYTDADLDAIYELAAFHDGNLIAAQQRYEDIATARLERYVASKQSIVPGSGLPAGDGSISTQPTHPTTFDEADAAVQEYLRQNNITEIG